MGGKNRTLLGRKDRGLLHAPVPVLVMCLMFCSIPVLFAQAPGVTQSAEAPASSPTDLSRNGAIWRHPVGFSFWYPSTFKAVDADGGVQLVPSGAAQSSAATAVAATELYYLTAESIQGSGITSPFDLRVIQYLDGLVASNVSPYLQRKAEPLKVPMGGGEGMSAEWVAAGQGGQTIVARIYTTIMQQFGVFLVAVGEEKKLDSRRDELTAIIRSIALGQGRIDQSIAGVWKLFSTRQLRNEDTFNFTTDDPRRADMVSDEQTSLSLSPDGTARRVSQWRSIARGGVSGGPSTVWLDSGEQKSEKTGRWNADSGILFIMWQNGGMDQWQYALSEGALRLSGSGQVQYWQR